jgi:hypothetical protein
MFESETGKIFMTSTETENFRGLLYNPALENEAVMLFCLLIPHLEDSYAIEEYSGSFPDCYALRNGQRVGIEFELFASNFNHENNDNLTKCSLLICWKNDIRSTIKRDGKEFYVVKGHEIEIIALKNEVEKLEKSKNFKFIEHGQRPSIYRGKERFFEQLKENRPRRYDWIRELYEKAKQSEDFLVDWGGGEKWLTMRFYVKKWDVNPISVYGDGSVEISYQGNKAQPPWFELPQETKAELRQIFKNPKQKWYRVPLEGESDLDNIYRALKVLAEHSKRFDRVIWHTKTEG